MKKIYIIILICISYGANAQMANFDEKNMNQLVNYFPTENQPIAIIDNPDSKFIGIVSSFNLNKIEVLDKKTNKVIHSQDSKGKIITVDRSKLIKGSNKLQIYSGELVISLYLYIVHTDSFCDDLKEMQISYSGELSALS